MKDFLKRMAFIALSEIGEFSEDNYPNEILVCKYGKNPLRKGNNKLSFDFTEADADRLIADFNDKAVEMMIDYEHQSLIKGQEAPAAGWVEKLRKTDKGLVAVIKEWTNKAKKYFTEREYKYHSPVLLFDKGLPSRLFNIALTNTPSLDNIKALIASEGFNTDLDININKGEQKMLKELLEKLGLLALSDKPGDEQEKAVVKKVGELVSETGKIDGFLKLHDCDSLDAVTGKIQGMVPATEKAELETKLKARDANEAVKVAMSDGKVSEAFKGWAVDFATRDLKAFKDWAAAAPKVVPDGGNTDQQESKKKTKHNDEDVKVLSDMPFSEEEIKKIMENE